MRDHRKLKVFEFADELALSIYKTTKEFPREEIYGLTAQLRRAAVSTASNIVEGSARDTEAEYLRFLDIAHGSAREVAYQLSIAMRLGYTSDNRVEALAEKTAMMLGALIRSLRSGPTS